MWIDQEFERIVCECKGEAWAKQGVFHASEDINSLMMDEADRMRLSLASYDTSYLLEGSRIIPATTLTSTLTSLLPAIAHLPSNMFLAGGAPWNLSCVRDSEQLEKYTVRDRPLMRLTVY